MLLGGLVEKEHKVCSECHTVKIHGATIIHLFAPVQYADRDGLCCSSGAGSLRTDFD